MRLFTAIELPNEMLEKLGGFLTKLRPLADFQWSPVRNLHITTKFIGEWPETRLDEMKSALARVKSGPVSIAVRGIGWFPNARRPRVFWVGVDAGSPLAKLAKATEEATATLGVPNEKRDFSPHLTLARISEPAPQAKVEAAAGNPDFGAFQAFSFALYLSSNGKYSKLAEFPLHT